ncbi:MAG: GNAT family N-acetyltransferase [Bdellovibrionota bacterium]
MEEIFVRIAQKLGSEVKEQVDQFYEKNGGGTRARNNDLFFLLFMKEQLAGTVRFCVEENTPMLRSMMIREACRGQGLGTKLLGAFVAYLDENKIRDVYCIPYDYLEKFYGAVGFRKAEVNEIPPFLEKRLGEYNLKPKKFICMLRSE